MQPVITISKGNSAFTARVLDKDLLINAVNIFLDKANINANIEIEETGSLDFLTVNGTVCRYPLTLVTDIEASLPETGNSDILFWNQFIHEILWMQPQVFLY